MKKLWAILLAGMVLFGSAGCRLYGTKMPEDGSLLSAAEGETVASLGESLFQKPPKGTLHTPDGDAPLTPAGYSWTAQNGDGTAMSMVADQAIRPLDRDSLKPVMIGSEHARTVYVPVTDGEACEPANMLGYLLELSWEAEPNSVTYTCWPEAVWKNSNVQQEDVVTPEKLAFYARPGGYIYEITAKWDDTGAGYYGTANYYVYIVAEPDHSHQTATQAQTVEDPVTGYCGNTWTTLYIGDEEYGFMDGNSVTLTDILVNLDYDPMRICRCRPEYTVDTEFGEGYGINLTAGYARCDKGQADLTQEQIDTITGIVQWAKTAVCKYPTKE